MKKTEWALNPKSRKAIIAIGCFFIAIFCSKAFVINPTLYIGKSAVPASTVDYLWSVFALALWALFYYAYGVLRLKPRVGEIAFGLLFGVLNFFGTSLFAYDSWAFIGVSLSWPEAAFKCLGQAFTMVAGLTLVSNWLRKTAEQNRQPCALTAPLRRFPRLRKAYREHTALVSAAFFLLCWLPYLVAFYPGTVIYDMCVIVRQFFGLEPLTTWHCPFTTLFFGSCVWLGRALGSDNFGTLIYMVLQSMLMAYALGVCMRYLRRLGVRRGWQAGALLFYGVVPIWGCYAMMIGKDTFYTATLMLFFLQTLTLAREGAHARVAARDWVAYGITAMLTCLWRNNGLYVVLPSAIGVIVFLSLGQNRLKVLASLGAGLAAAVVFLQIITPALGFVDNTGSAIYSICFQQTARTVRDHGQELTAEEKASINQVLDLEKIGKVYEPWISDPVKDTFRQFGQGEATEQAALKQYRATWLSMLRKYPVTYLQAFMANNCSYYAFTPKFDGITYNQQAGQRFVFINYWEPNEGELHTEQPDALTPLRNAMTGFANRWWTLPMLSCLYVFPFYTWLLIAVGLSLAHQRRWRALTVLLPALFSFAVCILSPVDSYLRYFLPIIAMTPPILAFVTHPLPAKPNQDAMAVAGQANVE